MGSTMHVISIIDQKSRQNGIDFGTGRFRCEEGRFGMFRFKVLPSARQSKYCHPFSEGDVVSLVGQFSYETVEDKVEGFTLNISVATTFPTPSSGCWDPEEIPLSAPYLSFNTQPVSGSLRQVENCQFIRTKSSINSGYTRRSTDPRFRIGYQIDNDRWDNIGSNWDVYSQFFISGFFLHVDNGEVCIEATEIELDPLTRKYGRSLSSSNSAVPGVSPLAKNLSRLLDQEKNSFPTLGPGIYNKALFEQTPNKEKKTLRPLAPKNSSPGSLQQSPGSQPDLTNPDTLGKDFLKGLQAYDQIIRRLGSQSNPQQLFSALQQQVPSLSEQQPSAEQIAELIADQGTRQDLSSPVTGVQSKVRLFHLNLCFISFNTSICLKYSDFYPVSVRNWQNDQPISPQLPSYSVWPLQGQETAIYNQRDKLQISSQVANQNDREKSATHQNERDKTSNSQQVIHQQELVKSPTQYAPPQNEREMTPSQHDVGYKNDSVKSSRAESESGESMDNDQNKKSGRKSLPEDKTKSVRPASRATLGNRFIVYEPKQESEGNKQDGTLTGKRGRKSKNANVARPAKKSKSKKNSNEADTTTTATTTTSSSNREEPELDSINESPKNITDKDSSENLKNTSEKSEDVDMKDDEVDVKTEK